LFSVLLVAGLSMFFDGFEKRRRKRLIENIPTSWVGSVAAGLCEIRGEAKPRAKPLRSPLSNTPCVYYKYLIERDEGRNGWATVAEDDSSHIFFLVDDSTGQALIDPAGAQFYFEAPDFQFRGGGPFERRLPDSLAAFLDSRGVQYHKWSGGYSMRFREWAIDEQDELYVLGTARKDASLTSDYCERLQAAVDKLKADPQSLEKVDTDNDGQISAGEWDAAVNAIRQSLLEEELKNPLAEGSFDTVIGQGEKEKMFIISERSEKELCSRLGIFSFLEIFGGAALCIMAAVLLFVGRQHGWFGKK